MKDLFGSPALLLLFRLKLKGGLRKQVRRLKQPKHWVFLILGSIAAFSWMFQVMLAGTFRDHVGASRPGAFIYAQLSMFTLVTLSFLGAFNYRGLYLPKDEIELAFSAPVSRGHLIRYRLFVSWMKSLIAVLLFGVLFVMRSGNGAYAFIGVFVSILSVSVFGQACSLLLGGAENRLGRMLKYLPTRAIVRIVVIVAVVGVVVIASSQFNLNDVMTSQFGGERKTWTIEGMAAIPIVHVLLTPFTPWARMVTAETFEQFLPWFLFTVGVWILLFEATVRINVDFRELSLATSADVAKRVSRIRRGNFNAGQAQVTRATIGWNAPWLFGRGAFGAVAWHKTASIMRKSRGALLLSIAIIAFLTILSTLLAKTHDDENMLVGSVIIAVVGTLYMCAGLRFDFRTDLDIMDRIKAWPVAPSMLFLATLLPEVVLVSGMLFIAVLVRALWLNAFHPAIVGVLVFQPLVTLTWVALDNAVFLFSPIRYTPGEEGAIQNMGRSMLLMILRGILTAIVVAVAGLPAWLTYFVVGRLGGTTEGQFWAAGAVAWFGLLIVDAALVFAGGKMLARFDVARDRPV